METERVSDKVYMIDALLLGRPEALSTYLILGNEGSMIIDPGPPSSIITIMKTVRSLNVKSPLVALTHIHLDHGGGSWRILRELENAKLYVHPRGVSHMVNPSQLLSAAKRLLGDNIVDLYGQVRGVDPMRVVKSRDGDILKLGDVSVEVIWTPGHASHHQCYYIAKEGVLIIGDAGGTYDPKTGYITPTSPPPFNPERAIESLGRLMKLNVEILCYGHFGYSDRGVELLKAHKRQIKLWMKTIEEGLKEGDRLEELWERLKVNDPMADEVWRYGLRERDFMNILGFVEYYRWIWSKSNKF